MEMLSISSSEDIVSSIIFIFSLEISLETLNCFAVGKNNFCSMPFTTSVDVTKRISFEIRFFMW